MNQQQNEAGFDDTELNTERDTGLDTELVSGPDICLGLVSDTGVKSHLWLDGSARLQHLHIIGRTGTGKTTLMHNLLAQDIFIKHGIALLDPHGDLAFDLLDAIPRSRTRNVIYFNPSDLSRPIGFNPLSDVPIERRAVAADGMLAAFKHQWADSWGPRLEHILFNALRLLLDMPRSSLLAIPKLLTTLPIVPGSWRMRQTP